jgi:hypothetical protein
MNAITTHPTQAELDFVYHVSREVCFGEPGPATNWLVENNLRYAALTAFQTWGWKHDDHFLARIYDDPLPPFVIPWSSREEFISRVYELMEEYPELKDAPFANPEHPLRKLTI